MVSGLGYFHCRLHVSILISDPGEEVRQKAAFMVESAAAESRPEQFVTDAADSLVRLLYKLMGVESCSRHILREDGAIILNPRTNSNQATLNDDNDDTKENDDDEMEVDREPLPSPPRFVISANPNPSSNKMKANKIPEMVPSRKRKPLSPKNNSQHVLNPSTEASTEEEGEEQPRLSQPPASAFAPSSAASLIRPSKRPRKVSPQAAAGQSMIDVVHVKNARVQTHLHMKMNPRAHKDLQSLFVSFIQMLETSLAATAVAVPTAIAHASWSCLSGIGRLRGATVSTASCSGGRR